MGLFALQHVGSSRTRARTCVPFIGSRILKHCSTREAHQPLFLIKFFYFEIIVDSHAVVRNKYPNHFSLLKSITPLHLPQASRETFLTLTDNLILVSTLHFKGNSYSFTHQCCPPTSLCTYTHICTELSKCVCWTVHLP